MQVKVVFPLCGLWKTQSYSKLRIPSGKNKHPRKRNAFGVFLENTKAIKWKIIWSYPDQEPVDKSRY